MCYKAHTKSFFHTRTYRWEWFQSYPMSYKAHAKEFFPHTNLQVGVVSVIVVYVSLDYHVDDHLP